MKTETKRLPEEHKRVTAVLVTMFMVFWLIWGMKLNVSAAESFQLYTDTPGINVSAGDSVTFNLYATGGASGEDVELSVESAPEDFGVFFKRDSYEVSRVHVGSDLTQAIASLQVTIPAETAEGTYDVVVKAQADDGVSDTLTISMSVTGLESGESNFVVEYPEQEGVTGTSFTYSTTIANNTLNTQTYNFSSSAPSGWNVSFASSSDSTQVSSIEVESGSSVGVTITVTPPEKVDAGEYEISCAATSAKEQLSNNLKVTILGTYDLEISTSDGRLSLDAYANKTSDVTLKITNSGNIDLSNINLSAASNSAWEITFDESVIESLEAGASKEIVAHITPDKDALTGDYVTYISADTDEQSASAEFRITVKTRTGWGIFAVVVIIAVAAGLGFVFKKYGRR